MLNKHAHSTSGAVQCRSADPRFTDVINTHTVTIDSITDSIKSKNNNYHKVLQLYNVAGRA